MPAGQPVLNKIITTYKTAKWRNKTEFKEIYILKKQFKKKKKEEEKKKRGWGWGVGGYFEKVQNGNHMRVANQT